MLALLCAACVDGAAPTSSPDAAPPVELGPPKGEAARVALRAEAAERRDLGEAARLYQAALEAAGAAPPGQRIGRLTVGTLRDFTMPRVRAQAAAEESPLGWARVTAHLVPSGRGRDGALAALALAEIAAGELAAALRTIDGVEDLRRRGDALAKLAKQALETPLKAPDLERLGAATDRLSSSVESRAGKARAQSWISLGCSLAAAPCARPRLEAALGLIESLPPPSRAAALAPAVAAAGPLARALRVEIMEALRVE